MGRDATVQTTWLSLAESDLISARSYRQHKSIECWTLNVREMDQNLKFGLSCALVLRLRYQFECELLGNGPDSMGNILFTICMEYTAGMVGAFYGFIFDMSLRICPLMMI